MVFNFPSSPSTCAALNQTVNCNFQLYANATNLSNSEKLAPNNDVTGRLIVKSFLASAIITLLLSLLLVFDKVKLLLWDARLNNRNAQRGAKAQTESKHYLKVINTIEGLLHTLSDQQLVASVALIVSINHQACTISAYHYNLVCTMLLMGIITHVNTLLAIPEFFSKGKNVAIVRFSSIISQFSLTIVMFSARDTNSFPVRASSLAILPAACFENMNATSEAGFSTVINVAQNATAGLTASNITSSAAASQVYGSIKGATLENSLGEEITLAAFMLLAVVIMFCEWAEFDFYSKPTPGIWTTIGAWAKIGLSGLLIGLSSIFVGAAITHYNGLRTGMEIAEWYQIVKEDAFSFSQILPIVLLGSGFINVVKAATESFEVHRSKRIQQAITAAQKDYRDGDIELSNLNGSNDD